jgi:sulfate permease, SulP family
MSQDILIVDTSICLRWIYFCAKAFSQFDFVKNPKNLLFRPKLIDTLKGYDRAQFTKDLMAGIIVGVVALPLAIAFGIASGVTPEQGLYTAIIAGFIISALGGSKVQIGGPTGAFIVIVYGIVQQFGVQGLIIATFIAGLLLILMGVFKVGSLIRYIPHPLIVGFTTGIAAIIFSSQIKDFLGLKMGAVPADFLGKWSAYGAHFSSINFYAVAITISTIFITQAWGRVTHKIPGSLIAILVTTLVVYFFPVVGGISVETIGSRFGAIHSAFPKPSFSLPGWATIQQLMRPAFTIALLGGIESLLSAVVADGMTGGKHRSNTELIAQGVANVVSAVFGGIPATGAIARTATNVRNGGRTPVAGMIHAVTLLLIVFGVGKLAALIPMATLAGILVVVSYNMSEWRNFLAIAKSRSNDTLILLVTFLLTVLVDLTVAIEVGMLLAAILFLQKMTRISNVRDLTGADDDSEPDTDGLQNYSIPDRVAVFEINGPLFFGAAYKFKDAIGHIERQPRVLIIRMRYVPVMDATGARTLEEVEKECRQQGIRLVLAEVRSEEVLQELARYRLLFRIGKGNILTTLDDALRRAGELIEG